MNGPAPIIAVDNKSLGRNRRLKCGFNHNTADCREIAKTKQYKKAQHEPKAVPGKKALSFLFEEINSLKKQLKPVKPENPKKRKAESLLSTEINLTNSSDEIEE
jgi:hypothetical protein